MNRLAVLLGAVGAGIAVPFLPLAATVGMLVSGGLLALTGSRLRRIAVGDVGVSLVLLGVVASTWNALRIGPVTLGDALMLAGGLVVLPRGIERFGIPLWIAAPAFAILVLVVIHAMGGADPYLGLSLAASMSVIVLIVAFSATQTRISIVAGSFVLSALVSAGIAVVDGITGSGIGDLVTKTDYLGREQGLSIHPTHISIACVMALPLAMQFRRSLAVVCVIVLFAAIMFSGSRSGIAAAILALTALIVIQRDYRYILPIALVVALGAALVSSLHIPLVGLERLTGGDLSTVTSDAEREALQEIAWSQFASSPLVGADFGLLRHAHLVYLQLLAAGGVVALMAFLAFVLRVTWEGARHYAPGCAAVAAWLAVGVVQNQITDRFLFVPAGLIVGAMLRDRIMVTVTSGSRPRVMPLRRPRPEVFRAIAERTLPELTLRTSDGPDGARGATEMTDGQRR